MVHNLRKATWRKDTLAEKLGRVRAAETYIGQAQLLILEELNAGSRYSLLLGSLPEALKGVGRILEHVRHAQEDLNRLNVTATPPAQAPSQGQE